MSFCLFDLCYSLINKSKVGSELPLAAFNLPNYLPDSSLKNASSSKSPSEVFWLINKEREYLNWIDFKFILKPEFRNEFHSSGSQNVKNMRDQTSRTTFLNSFQPSQFKNIRESLEQGQSNLVGTESENCSTINRDSLLPHVNQRKRFSWCLFLFC